MPIRIQNVRIAFPSLAVPQSLGDGEPAYQAKFIIEPNSPQAKQIAEAIQAAAEEQWKDKAKQILKVINEDKKSCYVTSEYRSKKTGEVYAGFEGKHYLSARNAKNQPTIVSKFGKPITDPREIESVIYSGCYVHAMLDIWAQDNKWGRRINCTLKGVMYAKDGDSFGGGGAPASVGDFADLATAEEDSLV